MSAFDMLKKIAVKLDIYYLGEYKGTQYDFGEFIEKNSMNTSNRLVYLTIKNQDLKKLPNDLFNDKYYWHDLLDLRSVGLREIIFGCYQSPFFQIYRN